MTSIPGFPEDTTFFLASGMRDAIRADDSNRRFFVVSAPFDKPPCAKKSAAAQAHADWLVEQQRKSGVRIRLCLTGCYSVYNDQGQFIARTPPPGGLMGGPAASLRTAAARMAYSEELAAMCRTADADYEQSGTVAPSTIIAIRELLSVIGAA